MREEHMNIRNTSLKGTQIHSLCNCAAGMIGGYVQGVLL